jgi:uncharacterized membrane protein
MILTLLCPDPLQVAVFFILHGIPIISYLARGLRLGLIRQFQFDDYLSAYVFVSLRAQIIVWKLAMPIRLTSPRL